MTSTSAAGCAGCSTSVLLRSRDEHIAHTSGAPATPRQARPPAASLCNELLARAEAPSAREARLAAPAHRWTSETEAGLRRLPRVDPAWLLNASSSSRGVGAVATALVLQTSDLQLAPGGRSDVHVCGTRRARLWRRARRSSRVIRRLPSRGAGCRRRPRRGCLVPIWVAARPARSQRVGADMGRRLAPCALFEQGRLPADVTVLVASRRVASRRESGSSELRVGPPAPVRPPECRLGFRIEPIQLMRWRLGEPSVTRNG